jgi:cellulose synthase/poly-beta-1,6-N-acetylglucosamine synthase-like glycosyltransferase
MTWHEVATVALTRLEWVVLGYFLFVNTVYAVLVASAALEMWEHTVRTRAEGRWRALGCRATPRISMIVPAHNEAATIVQSVRALLALHYPNLEVVVVNDGSRDETLDVLRAQYDLVPIHPIYRRHIPSQPVRGLYWSRRHSNLVVVDKRAGGKGDAQNAGLNLATGDLVCISDADTLIEPDALQRMVRPFLETDVVAVGGTIRVANGSRVHGGRVTVPRAPRTFLAGVQAVEYLRAFLFGRLGWNRLGENLIISGAFGLFRREAVIAAGGYAPDTVGEDMEMVTRLRGHGRAHHAPSRVAFVPDPVAWTEVPESLRALGRQRDRWHRGLAQVMWRHRRLCFNPRYGLLGLLVYPFYLLGELLAPVVEATGLIGMAIGLALGVVNTPFAVLFFLVAYGYGLVLTLVTLVLEELNFHRYERMRDRLLLLVWALVEPLGYRQLTVAWRLRGLLSFLRGRTDWGAMERRGFDTAPGTAPS